MKKEEILQRIQKPFTLKELKDLLNQTEIVDNSQVKICIERDGFHECFMLVGVDVSIGMAGRPTIYFAGMEFEPKQNDIDGNEIQNNYNEYAHITAENVCQYWSDNDIFDADGRWSANGTYTLKK